MFKALPIAVVSTFFILAASAASAHNAEMHKKKNAEKPKCETMQKMDHSSTDMNDPIMLAMLQQCKKSGEHTSMEQEHAETDAAQGHKDDGHNH